ncbi:hypothetical protein FGM00_11040 [Aggregatimonas sangjinii]|uniref:TerB family tellurite resistance protein n=1 Tax=Aggregatimonas sangjinii TaxID=2583587 RepID=A0A5B7SUP1_9FLAO|nr:hypothetical protein [Aggregatimonas sangjinii]QCX00611.1 hypothetical protein FGM00_11040 [Aggregatimonas sangjinii]
MNTEQNKYHNEFAGLVKITMRDGDASESEKGFLSHLATKLGMSSSEYDGIMENYLSYPLETIPTNKMKLENLYTLTQLVCEDDSITGNEQKSWLERMGKGMGFAHQNVPYIADKSIKMMQGGADLDAFVDGITNINQ